MLDTNDRILYLAELQLGSVIIYQWELCIWEKMTIRKTRYLPHGIKASQLAAEAKWSKTLFGAALRSQRVTTTH